MKLLKKIGLSAIAAVIMIAVLMGNNNAQAGNSYIMTVGVTGNYFVGQEEALARLNEIRKEACREGVADPRNPNRKLTIADYVPLKWSDELEEMARMRAAEASLTLSHTRPNGENCFSLGVENEYLTGEILTWNYFEDLVEGINQLYREKKDWVNKTGLTTGHYTQIIDPDSKYVGLGGFYSTKCGIFPSTLCGRFAYDDKKNNKPYDKSTNARIVKVQIDKRKITGYSLAPEKSQSNTMLQGTAGDYRVWLRINYDGNESSVIYLDKIIWSSSDETVITVENGRVTAHNAGVATLTAKTADGHTVKCSITVKADPGVHIISGLCGENVKWSLNSNGLMMIKGTGDMDDYKYSSRTPWYNYRSKIKEINISAGVTRIGTNAFYGCENLTSVTGCAGVASIGINTFRNCVKLSKVAGCKKVTLIEQYAFCGASGFGSIGSTTPGAVNLPACTKIGGYAFYECKGIKSLSTSYLLKYIGTRAFSNCTGIAKAFIGAGCTTIGSYAFCGNTSLTTVSGCAGVTGIGDFAFYGNTKLETVAGCEKTANVGKSVFRNCSAITKVGSIDGRIRFLGAKAVGEYAFSGCKAAKYISLGSNLTTIGQYAFQNDSAMTTLFIGSRKLETVGANAFKGVKATVYVPNAMVDTYKNGVLKGKGAVLTVKGA